MLKKSKKIFWNLILFSILMPIFKSSFAAMITYDGPAGRLIMNISYDQSKKRYFSKYLLVNKSNSILNKGQLKGCTYGGNITNIVNYLKTDMNLIHVTPIKYGFAIHYVVGCGGQNIWQLNVITSACVVSVPATDDNGKYVNIGNNPRQIVFGLLKGFGASRQVEKKYLTLDHNIIKYDISQSLEKNYRPKIICQ